MFQCLEFMYLLVTLTSPIRLRLVLIYKKCGGPKFIGKQSVIMLFYD